VAKAKRTKPRDHLFRWRMTLIKGTPAKYLGYVDAKDEAEAIREAAKEFKAPEALLDRIVATNDDF